MPSKRFAETFFTEQMPAFLPHLSVDCVVFGFHDSRLRLLLTKWKRLDVWALPGGYVGRRESVDAAAHRVLRDRTGLRRIHLRQFHAFGGLKRREGTARKLFDRLAVHAPQDAWPLHRVVSVGYYALVDFSKVHPKADDWSDTCTWYPLRDRPRLAYDHDAIVECALSGLRERLDSPTASASLMPDSFTMPELQRLHEAILEKRLDRRNFQKRMLERGALERLPQRRTGAHRASFLYRFHSRDVGSGFSRIAGQSASASRS